MKKRKKLMTAAAAALAAVTVFTYIAIETEDWVVESDRIPDAFDGLRITLLADFHGVELGEDNRRLLAAVAQSQPDLIAITGDLVDSRKTDIGIALAFAREAVKIAPCCYVPGNHEARIPEYARLETGLQEAGVTVR